MKFVAGISAVVFQSVVLLLPQMDTVAHPQSNTAQQKLSKDADHSRHDAYGPLSEDCDGGLIER